MLIMSGGKTFGENLAIATDSAVPPSTSARTSPSTRASSLLSVCSERIRSARSSGRPLFTIVANWRAMMARSFSFTFLPMPGMLISRFIPALTSLMLTGA